MHRVKQDCTALTFANNTFCVQLNINALVHVITCVVSLKFAERSQVQGEESLVIINIVALTTSSVGFTANSSEEAASLA